MRSALISYLLLFSLFTNCTESTKVVEEDKKLIREARQKSNDAIAQKDTTTLAEGWTDDYHIISSRNFEISGSENNRHNFSREFTIKKELLYVRTPTKIEVYADWNMASEQGTWSGQWLEPDGLVKLSRTYLAKWHKIHDHWKIRAEIFVPLSCSGSSFCNKEPF